MSEVHIVAGDLEVLSGSLDDLAYEVGAVNVRESLAGAPSAMPGSASASSVTTTADTVNSGLRHASQGYGDLSNQVMDLLHAHMRNDDKVSRAFHSYGSSSESTSPEPGTPHSGNKLFRRMERQ